MERSFYEDKKVLVAGGAGFVGRHFVDALLSSGARVRIPVHQRNSNITHDRLEVVSADLMDPTDCARALAGVDYVVHAAGAVGSAGIKANAIMAGITKNLILTAQLLQAAWEAGVSRFLLFGSSTGYPVADHPLKEHEMWAGTPPEQYWGYGWQRRYFERLAEFVASQSAIHVAIVRPTATYGRWDNFDPATSHVIPSLIRRAVAHENPFRLWGTGEEVRDFLHIADLVRGSLLVLEKGANCDPFNIGYGQTILIKNLVQIILTVAEHEDVTVIYNNENVNAVPIRMLDTTKAKQALGFEPRISLERGIRDTVEWYKGQS
jgi:GDP-L-fucose synthase